jgi:hypothetical protein
VYPPEFLPPEERNLNFRNVDSYKPRLEGVTFYKNIILLIRAVRTSDMNSV